MGSARHRRRRSRCAAWLLLALLLASPVRGGPGQTEAVAQPNEYEVKAAFLYHFAQLVTWPPGAGKPDGGFVVGVVGRDPFVGVLEPVVLGRTVRDRPIRVVHAETVSGLGAVPQIVVVGAEEARGVRRTLAALEGRPILTVSSVPGFAHAGGMIEFRITPDHRVGFDVNLRAVERAGLRMSSQLLRIARVVEGQP